MLAHPTRRIALCATAIFLTIALFGCGGNSLSKPFGTDPNDVNKERELNVLVGGPSAAVNFAQRSITLNPTPLAFGQSDSYTTVSSGSGIATDAFESGTTTKVAPETSVTMTRNFYYTEVVTGIYGTSGATAPQLIQFSDNFPTSVPASSVAIRLANVSPSSPPITLYNTTGAPATAVAITGLGNVGYGNLSNTGSSNYALISAGAYDLTVRDNAGNVLASLGSVTLNGGHIYSVFFYGLVAPTGSQPAAAATLLTDQ